MVNSKIIKSASWSFLLLSAGGNPKSAPHLAFHGKCVLIVHGKEPRGHSEQDADSRLPRHTDCTKKMDFILFDEGSGGPQGVADWSKKKKKKKIPDLDDGKMPQLRLLGL